jgi:uncharacterized membrane protein
MIPNYNSIDVDNDSVEVIQAKIDALKAGLASGEVTEEEYNTEKVRVENALAGHKLNYAFTW